MSSTKSFALKALRSTIVTHRLSKPVSAPFQTALSKSQLYNRAPRPAFVPVRWHSIPASARSKDYDFTQIKEFASSPSEDRILIGKNPPITPTHSIPILNLPLTTVNADVREPSEYAAGYIPTALNIPVKSQPDAMFLPEEEFEDRFGFSKPPMDKELVFYCKAGVRSSAAAQLAKQVGYENVAEYKGSWMDWEKNGGQSSK
jgi:rhodanese-related sulfurtransferase